MDSFSSFCTPSKLYLILAIVGLLSSSVIKFNAFYFIFSILFIYVWSLILNWICNKGYEALSWFLVLLPLISVFVFVGLLFSMEMSDTYHNM